MARRLAQQRGLQDNNVLAIQDWLLRLEALRYAPHGPGRQRLDLATLKRELNHLNWPT